MQLYFAPLEGIGGYLCRNVQAECFPKADKYFAPFLAPNQNRAMNDKERRDVLPENNPGICLVPQILTNRAECFLSAAQALRELGYNEVNLNLGCPSGTVVKKYKGAGFLADPDSLDAFLDAIYAGTDMHISIKTRLGMTDPEEFEEILEIYNQYPVCELIIHPRVQKEFYRGAVHLDAFETAFEKAKMPVVYNGDICGAESYEKLRERFPFVERFMMGRGVLSNPCLFGELRGIQSLTKESLFDYHERLLASYQEHLSGETVVLFKMKEHWFYMIQMFADADKYMKKIRKAQRICDYREAVRSLFVERDLNS